LASCPPAGTKAAQMFLGNRKAAPVICFVNHEQYVATLSRKSGSTRVGLDPAKRSDYPIASLVLLRLDQGIGGGVFSPIEEGWPWQVRDSSDGQL
jgi:hypothetical protein